MQKLKEAGGILIDYLSKVSEYGMCVRGLRSRTSNHESAVVVAERRCVQFAQLVSYDIVSDAGFNIPFGT